ncbi:HlyD family efflux transporter periplasmic adaptor subunit [Spirosoma montaniterrae]|uniref:HlyD family efflux transporter periplasmic adaptor subunit n=1 Tax=Spirosoma montaniterrae TaxID=1178516 RepID=UPI0018DD86E9|nr:HlyD family efflux transporter periplasmic adaptor subunit [Spirosoma montaniterrae]
MEAPPVLYDAAGQSEAVSEVLSQPPASIVRWGTTVLFGALLLLLAGAWFIRYPDVIPGNALITTEQPPLKLLARANGRLTSLLVDDNTFVKRGTLLAEIDNTTRLENIPKLHRFITDARRLLADPTYTLPLLPEGIALGDAQDDYNHIVKSYREHKRLLTDSYHGQQAAMLQQQITDYQQLIDLNERQLVLTEQEYGNAEQKYQTNASLYRQKVHSRLEFLDMENNFLQKKKERETFRKVIVENRLILADKRRQLSEMSYQLLQKTRSHRDNIELHVRDIENALQVWQYTYVLTAPTDGKLIYLSQLVKNQPVRIADTLFAVLPASRQPYVGFVTVPAQGAGKVRVGQWVVIKLNDFPYREYGVLRGRVMKIAPTTTPRTYRLQVSLPNGLVSSYAKTLRFKPEMTGSAEIITDDMRLLERAFHNLRGLAAN